MKKIILDKTSFDYSWSMTAQLNILMKKHYKYELYAVVDVCGFEKFITLNDDEFLEAQRYLRWHTDSPVKRLGFNILSGDGFFLPEAPDRDDTDAIELIEEFGSEHCSSGNSTLVVEEYDDSYFTPIIVPSQHGEVLGLMPFTKERIQACKSVQEVIDYLDDHCVFG